MLLHNLLNVLVQFGNKMGLPKKKNLDAFPYIEAKIWKLRTEFEPHRKHSHFHFRDKSDNALDGNNPCLLRQSNEIPNFVGQIRSSSVGIPHMSDNRQMSVSRKQFVEFMSMVTQYSNNTLPRNYTGATTTTSIVSNSTL
jgi:hypothetical protein